MLLNEETSEKVTFIWTEEMQKSFDALKLKLITVPVSAYSDYQKSFLVCSDASNKAAVAVLSQLDDKKTEYPILHASRILSDTDSNYSAFEGEALGVIFAWKKLQPLFDVQQVQILYRSSSVDVRIQNERHAWMDSSLVHSPHRILYNLEICYRAGQNSDSEDYLSKPIGDNLVSKS